MDVFKNGQFDIALSQTWMKGSGKDELYGVNCVYVEGVGGRKTRNSDG